ncbi:hypothetical protein MMC08_008816 [Hypocenomyce scalaris]|nr:hypothetical protein [Hypocenomyce scalaris]
MPPSIPSLPLLDGNFIHDAPTFTSAETWSKSASPVFPGLKWCQELFVGDSQMDVRIRLELSEVCIHEAHKWLIQNACIREVSTVWPLEVARKESRKPSPSLLSVTYPTTNEKTDDSAAYLAILEFANDICFYLPAETFARKLARYNLSVPSERAESFGMALSKEWRRTFLMWHSSLATTSKAWDHRRELSAKQWLTM